MRHEQARLGTAGRLLGALLTCLLAATVVVAAQRPQGHPHTIRAGAVAAVNAADSGHAPTRIDHDAVPPRTPFAALGDTPRTAPAKRGSALYESTADFRPVRGPPLQARG